MHKLILIASYILMFILFLSYIIARAIFILFLFNRNLLGVEATDGPDSSNHIWLALLYP